MSKHAHTPGTAAIGIDRAISIVEGRWKLVILFHLFGRRSAPRSMPFLRGARRIPAAQLR